MAEIGLLPTGFVIPTIQEIREEIEALMRAEFGASIPLGDRTWLGHLIGIVSERIGLVWEGCEAVNSSQDPDKATQTALRVIGKLTGCFEIEAGPSTVTETLCGDDGTVVATGFIVKTESTGKQFETIEDCTLTQLAPWAANGNYVVDDRVTNTGRSYVCITAGVADSSGGPNTTDDDITDNTVHWRYLGEGEAAADVPMESIEDGPIEAISNDLSVIDTPVGGVNSAKNIADADLGRDAMTDEEFRILRETLLTKEGTGVPDAIRAAMLEVSGVTNCTVFFNSTDAVDADGLPAHSCEVLVKGGADADVFQALWDNVPIGTTMIGDEVGTVVDSEGYDQTVRFSRPEELEIWVEIDLEKYVKEYDGDATVKAAIVAWGDAQRNGKDVVASAISAQCFRVDGVLDVSQVLIGTANPPVSGATIAVGRRQLALYDTSRITINTTDGLP